MFDHLQIYDARERWLVGCADALLGACARVIHRRRDRHVADAPRRILLLRLERIGDLLMTLAAIDAVRTRVSGAEVHLVVGSWNETVARLIPGINSLETLDVPWLVRQGSGASNRDVVRRARAWRARGFDLALNFEPDIRSNLLLALSGARLRYGFSSGGGGALLTHALSYAPRSHTATNAMRLVDTALPATTPGGTVSQQAPYPRLLVPGEARERARRILARAGAGRVVVGLHASGGRPIKQWHLDRFARVADRLIRERGVTIVLTGGPEDRPIVDQVKAALPPGARAVDLAGPMDLVLLAGLLEQLSLLITGDTGPMHLAAAVGTPVVALFGPSDPNRYGPLTERARIVRVDLWCRPCNRVRRPPARCVGHVPDCLSGVDVDQVCQAADDLLAAGRRLEEG